jgi:hypothetical protein
MNTRIRMLQRWLGHFTSMGPPIRSSVIYEHYYEYMIGQDEEPMGLKMFALGCTYFCGVGSFRSGGKSYLRLSVSSKRIKDEDRAPDQRPGSRAYLARSSRREREPTIAELKRSSRMASRLRQRNRDR